MGTKPKSSELNPGPGFRVNMSISRLDNSLVKQFSQFLTTDISDLMNRLYTMSWSIKNLVNNQCILGTAITVKVFPGDNLMVHKALDIAQPGDIIVIDASSTPMNAVIGDLVAQKAQHRGIAGFIVDGLIRDLKGIQEIGIPVFARGTTPIGPLHRGPGEINYPVSCGGIVVNPGDIIMGDKDGVIVIQQQSAPDILKRAYQQQESLADYIANVKKGIFSNDWVDQQLADSGCIIHSDHDSA
ncbi:MAG TPA: RraA family protein [Thiotrichaceae bacterium]|nr:RraA family protein [Thiotrichaceae bacterium]